MFTYDYSPPSRSTVTAIETKCPYCTHVDVSRSQCAAHIMDAHRDEHDIIVEQDLLTPKAHCLCGARFIRPSHVETVSNDGEYKYHVYEGAFHSHIVKMLSEV